VSTQWDPPHRAPALPSPVRELQSALSAERRETHISWVLLAGEAAYKLKTPVRFAFVDYGTLERRRALCHEEVRLNRRLAPDVYRGVLAVVPTAGGAFGFADEQDPRAVEYAVEMRRYDEDATLLRRLAAGTAGETDVSAVGRRLAEFHAAAAIPLEPERTVARLWSMLDENFASLRELVPTARGRIDGAERLAAALQRGRREELLARAGAGLVRDGHGDLRAEHVVLERGIEVVDCVEFDPLLREQDVGLDLAFLVMDLMRRDERLARALETAYREAGGDPGDDALVRFFAAQRALIRAKVALIRAGQVEAADAGRRSGEAAELLDLADLLGWSVRLGDLAVVCGVAASGKSTLAAALAERAGATVISSDVVRKRLLGIDPTARAPTGAYADDVNRRTYDALGRLAWRLVEAGDRVVVDATFRFAADRRAFAAARGDAEPAVWIECRAPASVLTDRAARRATDPQRVSDADAGIVGLQIEEWEPLDEIPADRRVVVATDRPAADVVAAAAEILDERLQRG
jgi:uncharacterized protein